MRKPIKTLIRKNIENIGIKRLEDELSATEVKKINSSTKAWETGRLGASAKHAKPISDEEEQALDAALGLQLISIRIQKSLIEQLRHLAKLEGMGYQTFMRQVLTNYARENEYKLEQFLQPNQIVQQAENLFMQALKQRATIATVKPLSHERASAEYDYSTILGKANILFNKAYGAISDPVLKKHAKLRLNQIADLCREQSDNSSPKKLKKVG